MSDGTMNTEVPIDGSGMVYHLAARAQDVADNVILVGDPGRVEFVSGFFDDGSIRFRASNREIRTITGTYKGTPVTAMSTGMGTDNVEIVLTELHIIKEYDVGTRKWGPPRRLNIIRCGTCGCPQPDVDAGTLAITNLALGMDNTGRFYSPEALAGAPDGAVASLPAAQELKREVERSDLRNIPPYISMAHPAITTTLAELGSQRKRKIVVGHTASASGFYACQGRKVGRLAKIRYPDLPDMLSKIRAGGRKVVNIEMETSALCQISNILGYRAGSVCVVLANRASGKGSLLPDSEKVPAMTDCVRLALDTLHLLNRGTSHL